jgi:single-stranded-DNA-specific exonuclease
VEAAARRHPLLELAPPRWREPPAAEVPPEVESEADHPLLARLLAGRGFTSAESVRGFLDPAAGPRTDPYALPGVREAVDRLAAAVNHRERVLVWGDFDADGQTATAVVVLALQRLGLDPAWHVPVRARDSHGLNDSCVERARAAGASLVVTCDCGVSDHAHVRALRDAGVDTIVTDHHAISSHPPAATVLVSPRLLPRDHPASPLSGVGVAYYLVTGLLIAFGRNANDMLDLVALGTIADVAPLVGENRRLVWAGLPDLNAGRRPGIAALLRVAQRLEADRRDAGPAGWALGPRLNAFGRLDDAAPAVGLLLCEDPAEARRLAEVADRLNRERIELTDRVLAEALERIENPRFLDGPPPPALELRDGALVSAAAIVVVRPEWPAGVIGLAATRLIERYLRPIALVAVQDGVARVSVRSPGWCDLVPLVETLSRDTTIGFRGGSHSAAAGGSLPAEQVGPFALAFSAAAAGQRRAEPLRRDYAVDAELSLADVSLASCLAIGRMAPFGNGCREPLFLVRRVDLAEPPRVIGERERHIMLTLVDAHGARARAVWWDGAGVDLPPGRLDLLVRLERNDWGESSSPRLVVQDVRPAAC